MDSERSTLFSEVKLFDLSDAALAALVSHVSGNPQFYNSVLSDGDRKELLALAAAGDRAAAVTLLFQCQKFLKAQEGPVRVQGDLKLFFPKQVSAPATPIAAQLSVASSSGVAPGVGSQSVSTNSSVAVSNAGVELAAGGGGEDDDGTQDEEEGDDAETSSENEIVVRPASVGAVASGANAVDQAVSAAVEARAAAFLQVAPAEHAALPSFLRLSIAQELKAHGVLGFRETDATPLSAQVDDLLKAYGTSFLAPSMRGTLPPSSTGKEAALYHKVSDNLKLLALLTAARVTVRSQVFGNLSEAMAARFLTAIEEHLVHEINTDNFARAQLHVAGNQAARDLFVATASATAEGRQHLTFSPVYEPLMAAVQTTKTWAASGLSTSARQQTSSSASTSSSSSSNTSSTTTSSASKKNKKNRNKKNNNQKNAKSDSQPASKPATPVKSPAKDKQ